MHEQPKSMFRYVAIAILLVALLLYFVSAHVNQKVTLVSGDVAQTSGVTPQDSKVAQSERTEAVH